MLFLKTLEGSDWLSKSIFLNRKSKLNEYIHTVLGCESHSGAQVLPSVSSLFIRTTARYPRNVFPLAVFRDTTLMSLELPERIVVDCTLQILVRHAHAYASTKDCSVILIAHGIAFSTRWCEDSTVVY